MGATAAPRPGVCIDDPRHVVDISESLSDGSSSHSFPACRALACVCCHTPLTLQDEVDGMVQFEEERLERAGEWTEPAQTDSRLAQLVWWQSQAWNPDRSGEFTRVSSHARHLASYYHCWETCPASRMALKARARRLCPRSSRYSHGAGRVGWKAPIPEMLAAGSGIPGAYDTVRSCRMMIDGLACLPVCLTPGMRSCGLC